MSTTSTQTSLTVRPLPGAPFGAEILGVDPRNIGSAQRDVIWQAYGERHGLLCFSFERLLSADELHALTAVFGTREYAPGRINGIGKGVPAGQEHLSVAAQADALRAQGTDPFMAYIGNVDPHTLDRKTVDARFYGEWAWHSDMSYIEVPPTFSLLHAREVPAVGGDTGFCSQVMAARSVPPALRERLRGVRIKHDSTYGSSGVLRPGMTPPASPVEALGHAHPVLRRIARTGDEALFLGRRTNAYVLGLSLADSERLLDEVWAHATRPEFCYRHHWRMGQVVVWDNRMLMHKREPVDDSQRRFMWRTQTRGEAVVAAVQA